jgi:hypothetical protein
MFLEYRIISYLLVSRTAIHLVFLQYSTVSISIHGKWCIDEYEFLRIKAVPKISECLAVDLIV